MIVAVFSVPMLIRGLGKDRFGILALAWALIGYAGFFDLGLGRALTQLVAKKLGTGDTRAVRPLAWTSLTLMLLLGILGSVVVMLASPWLVRRALKIPTTLEIEALQSFYLLGLSIPAVIVTTGLRGLLEAHQQFLVVNALRLPMGILTFIGPIIALPFSGHLPLVIGVLVLGRFMGCVAHAWACLRVLPDLGREPSFDVSSMLPLLSFGGWMTVNNVLGPLMLYVDRFLIGSLLSVAAVAYYTAPLDIVMRFAIIPNAVVGVLFPAFAMSLHRDSDRAALLMARGLKYVYLAVFPVSLFLGTFAHEILSIWLGPVFEHEGSVVLRWVAAGIFVNALSTIPFTLIQSAGRPNVTAWLLIAELPLYASLLWWMTHRMGLNGAAIAWTLRLMAEAVFVFAFSYRLLPQKPKFLSGFYCALLGGIAILYLATLPQDQAGRLAFFCGTTACFGVLAWRWGLSPTERVFLAEAPAQIHAD